MARGIVRSKACDLTDEAYCRLIWPLVNKSNVHHLEERLDRARRFSLTDRHLTMLAFPATLAALLIMMATEVPVALLAALLVVLATLAAVWYHDRVRCEGLANGWVVVTTTAPAVVIDHLKDLLEEGGKSPRMKVSTVADGAVCMMAEGTGPRPVLYLHPGEMRTYVHVPDRMTGGRAVAEELARRVLGARESEWDEWTGDQGHFGTLGGTDDPPDEA